MINGEYKVNKNMFWLWWVGGLCCAALCVYLCFYILVLRPFDSPSFNSFDHSSYYVFFHHTEIRIWVEKKKANMFDTGNHRSADGSRRFWFCVLSVVPFCPNLSSTYTHTHIDFNRFVIFKWVVSNWFINMCFCSAATQYKTMNMKNM